jgi:ATP adenylyltransferase
LSFLPGADRKCFLCRGAADPANPARHVIHHDQQTLTVLNRYPYNNGHLLVAPRRHCARLDELAAEEQAAVVAAIAQMIRLLEKVLRPEGFNVGLNLGQAAGAGLPGHLHWHIVPRWSGDTNFMPSVASVKVIPQSLEDLREALAEALHGAL